VAFALLGLAEVCKNLDRIEEAQAFYLRAIAIREAKLPPDHPFLLDTRSAYADLLREMGRQEEARLYDVPG